MKTLIEFINEAKETKEEITHRKGNPEGMFSTEDGSYLSYTEEAIINIEDKNTIEIQLLNVVNKRQGTGTKLIKSCIEYANSIGKDIVVYASPLNNEISEDDLIKMYKNCGFSKDSSSSDKHLLRYKNKKK